MAYDRYDTRDDRERGRFSDYEHDRGRRDERGFFERAGDEIASWFGDDEAERRRREDERMNRGWSQNRDRDRDRYTYGGWGGEAERDRYAYRGSRRDWDRWREEEERGSRPMNRESGDRDYRRGYSRHDRDFSAREAPGGTSRGTMSPTGPSFGYDGTYGAGNDRGYGSGGWGGAFTGSDYERREFERSDQERSERPLGREHDRQYQAWRQRQLNELDRDYDEYRREHQDRFESEFGTWRQNRQRKRGLLGQVREHMDVVGSDGETVGKVDCVEGDRIILTRTDSDDNRHHSLKCTMIDTIEGDEVRLDIPAEEAKSRFRDEDRRGEGEDVNLERSFAGTYR